MHIQESLASAKVSARAVRIIQACIEQICNKSTQGTQCWKVHSVGYNAGLSSFV